MCGWNEQYLENAEGEDVVSGIRTPEPLSFLENNYPELYNQVGSSTGHAGISSTRNVGE